MLSKLQVPQSLIQFEPSVQIYEDMKLYHQNRDPHHFNTIPQVEDVIDAIFPPREWTDHMNKLNIQYVSHQPASRQDVIQLTSKLEQMLKDRQAKKNGICGIRQQLFSQTFDQIIRQVTIDCPQRGLLLMRVRDQHKMTLAAYQTIYQSSVSYGIRKQVQSQQGTDNLQQQIKMLQQKYNLLENKKDQLLSKKDLLEKQNKDNKQIQNQRRQQQLKFLQMQTENLGKFLQSVKIELRYN